ncbi:MAG: dUTP diphosphatase [Egibacteraceae bacterium]
MRRKAAPLTRCSPDERQQSSVSEGKLLAGRSHEGVEPSPVLRVRRLDPGLPLPSYAHPGDAGLDLRAREHVTLAPGERTVVPTGVAVAVPPGCVGLVHPRSGLAARHGVTLVNAPGTIDAGYRGEVKVILANLDPAEPVHLARGDRIAQLVVQRVETVCVQEVSDLDETARGLGGFGSTGR